MASRRGRRRAEDTGPKPQGEAKYLVVNWRRTGRYSYRGAIFEPGIIGAPGHPERLNPNAVRAVTKAVRDHLVGTGFFRDVTPEQLEEAQQVLLYARGGLAAIKAQTVASNTRRRRSRGQVNQGDIGSRIDAGGTPL